MPHRIPSCCSALVLALLWPTASFAAERPSAEVASPDWPQYRGPDRDGSVEATGLADAWPADGPVQLWRRTIGSGFSAISVRDDIAYTMEAMQTEEAVIAIDAASGETKWRTVIGTPIESEFGRGPRSTPTVAGDRVFTVSSQSTLVALDAASGEIHWQRDLSLYGPPPRFGYSSSPLVRDGIVVADIGTQDLMDAARARAEAAAKENDPEVEPEVTIPPQVGAAAGFDAATGEMRWRGGFPGGAGYTAPMVLTLGGVEQMVFIRRDSAVGVDFDGNALWTFPTEQTAAIAMPVQLADDVFFMSTSDDHFGGKAIQVSRAEDGSWSAEEAWSERLMRNHFNTSVTRDGVLFGFDNTTLKALDAATGERLWAHRGFGKGSLLAGGNLLYVLGDTGELALVHATGEGYRETGRVRAMDGKAWTAPSLANGRIFLRDHDEIVAYDVRASAIAEAIARGDLKGESTLAGDLSVLELAAKQRSLEDAAKLNARDVVKRFLAARRADRWQDIETLEISGTYHAFSETSDFLMRRARAQPGDTHDLFYLHYTVFEAPAVRAVDAEGPWLQHTFLSPQAVRTTAVPQLAAYTPQMLREAVFGPLFLRVESAGLSVERAGTSEINGRPTVDLKVIFPKPESPNSVDGEEPRDLEAPVEIWHLDPETFLEIAVDSQIVDYTQGGQPFRQRAYFSDFREIGDGALMPFHVELEFNARFESMTVGQVDVNPGSDPSVFSPPETADADSSDSESG